MKKRRQNSISFLNRNKKLLIFIVLVLISTPLIFVANYFIFIKARIFSSIIYDVNNPNFEELINKVETFDYFSNLEFHSEYVPVNNQTQGLWIDEDYINYLNEKINNDIEFHWFPFYSHYFIYSFYAEQQPQIYLTYNNNTILNSTYINNTLIFSTWSSCYGSYYGSWYINFTEVPFVYNENEKITLNDTIIVKQDVEYRHDYGTVGAEHHYIEQYVILDENFEIILIAIPEVFMVVA